MPKKYGVKEKDLVVAHVVNLVLTGKLRSGDRLDRNEIAEDLGLSRVPVQEAVVQLEHDGVLLTRYHRGAFVQRFDEDVVLENHELYGVLNGIASARAAADPTPKLIHKLEKALDTLRASAGTRAFYDDVRRYRKTINDGYAGPRLRAAIHAAQIFMPQSYSTTFLGSHDELVPFFVAETDAIRNRDPGAARTACVDLAEVMGRNLLTELVRRRVLGPNSATDGSATPF